MNLEPRWYDDGLGHLKKFAVGIPAGVFAAAVGALDGVAELADLSDAPLLKLLATIVSEFC